jgi:diacylglycerol kinase family enzyme
VLEAAGRAHRILVVDDPRRLQATAAEAVALAQAARGIVVAAGGDGTLNTVAQAVLGSGCFFGVLPQGTFNYFGRVHGIPAETTEAARLLLTARACPVQVGLVNDKVFLVNASLGLYPQLLEDREAWKRRLGRSRFVAFGAALATLLRAHRRLRLQIEMHGRSRAVRTPTLFVGNNRLQMEQVGTAQAFEEGHLAGIVLRPVGALGMMWLVLRGALSRLADADNVTAFGFDSLTVRVRRFTGRRSFKVATDGEVTRLPLPLVFRVSPEPLWLLKPEP